MPHCERCFPAGLRSFGSLDVPEADGSQKSSCHQSHCLAEQLALLCPGILSAPPAQNAVGSIATVTNRKEYCDLARLVREQGLGDARGTERSGLGDSTEQLARHCRRAG